MQTVIRRSDRQGIDRGKIKTAGKEGKLNHTDRNNKCSLGKSKRERKTVI